MYVMNSLGTEDAIRDVVPNSKHNTYICPLPHLFMTDTHYYTIVCGSDAFNVVHRVFLLRYIKYKYNIIMVIS